ncbi:phosphatase PAP2 family protein [uncultured Methanobrevibacter sp.]|uniref:phosphatase PAP2 family protein n=1 Tax=uncultured Methanobrevibacter sp. TaxID=253161 RepID=UPI0025FC4823|nr:phosphatase PAP2 family protein [uncultured Methanobrevibacter sp.]
MSNIQIDLLYFINNGLQNPILDKIVPIIYSLTDVRVILGLIILALIASWILKNDKVKKIALLCLLAYGFSIILIMISKTFYPSPRPFIALEGIRLTVHDNGFYSFPSGHFGISTTVISVILLKADKYKNQLIVLAIIYLLMLAFVVMYGGVHYPIDIIGGGVIGVISAVIIVRVLGKYLPWINDSS